MTARSKSYSVVAFSLPEEYFPDDDDTCVTAGTHIAEELGGHLEKHGHIVPEWVKGGCREDAWVYLESQRNGVRYFYEFLFFTRSGDTQSMAVRYGVRVSFWRRLFRGEPELAADDPIHEVLRTYGVQHEKFELLTASQFNAEYLQR